MKVKVKSEKCKQKRVPRKRGRQVSGRELWGRSERDTHRLALDLARHRLGALDDAVDVLRDVLPEGEVEHPRLVAPVEPRHHLVAREQAQLLLEVELRARGQRSAGGAGRTGKEQGWGVAYLWLGEAPTHGHERRGEDSLGVDGPDEVLHVRREAERHDVVGREHGRVARDACGGGVRTVSISRLVQQ